jgi:hypothetical protein
MDLPFLFRCPFTGRTAQGVTEADVLAKGPPTQYVGVSCTACQRLHIVSPQTGPPPEAVPVGELESGRFEALGFAVPG